MEERAYDLNTFAERPEEEQRTIRVVRGGKKGGKVREGMHTFKLIAVAALMLGLLCSLLNSYATITALTQEIQTTQKQLNEEIGQYDYLSATLNSKTNIKTVEEVAGSRLGLMKIDASQITYIDLETQSVIEMPKTGAQKLLTGIENFALNIAAELNP